MSAHDPHHAEHGHQHAHDSAHDHAHEHASDLWPLMTTAGVCAIWGITLVALLSTGRHVIFLPNMAWLLMIGIGLTVLFLAGMTLQSDGAHAHDHGHDHEHGPGRFGQIVTASIVLLPLIFLPAALKGDGFGARAFRVMNTDQRKLQGLDLSAVAAEASGGASDPSGRFDTEEAYEATLVDLAFEAEAFEDEWDFEGSRVVVVGRLLREASLPDDQVVLYRFAVTCCAADATAVSAIVQTSQPISVEDDGWARVTGLFRVVEEDDFPRPVILNARIEPIEAPAVPYLEPMGY